MNTFDPITTITDCCGIPATDGGRESVAICAGCGDDCDPRDEDLIPYTDGTFGVIDEDGILCDGEIRIDTPCLSCGREEDGRWYSPCPSDECPSYWEEQGIEHPDYPREIDADAVNTMIANEREYVEPYAQRGQMPTFGEVATVFLVVVMFAVAWSVK